MDKKGGYVNYIIEDLIKKTEVDYILERVRFPFPFTNPLTSYPFYSFLLYPHSFSSYFYKHIESYYGVPHELKDKIWVIYKERILESLKI
tara:strand:+ start:333 stop:602 length:270 start_codon:yes stop_codon:yes gene_type:complete